MRKFVILVSLAALAALVPASPALADTWIVDNDGADCPNADSTSIQAAVALAGPGDTIVVCEGVYEETVTVNKNDLKIRAKGPEGAVRLQGKGEDYGFGLVGVAGVVLEGFTVIGYQDNIELNTATANVIRHNVTTAATRHAGIFLDVNSKENLVEHNHSFANIGDVGTGIRIAGPTSADNVVRHNITESNSCAGIQLGTASGSLVFPTQGGAGLDNVVVHNTTFANGRSTCVATGGPTGGGAARGAGINNVNSSGTLIAHNRVEENENIGIFSSGVTVDVMIEHNLVRRNGVIPLFAAPTGDGIRIQSGTLNTVRYNDVRENGRAGVHLQRLEVIPVDRPPLPPGQTVVEHNVLDANGTAGVDITNGSKDAVVRFNVSRNHNVAGYRIGFFPFGILNAEPPSGNFIVDNLAKSNHGDGVLLEAAVGNVVRGNQSDNNGGDGLHACSPAPTPDGHCSISLSAPGPPAPPGTANNLIESNKMMANGLFDCRDDTLVPLNQWVDNKGRTENRPGLCEHGRD